MDGVFHTPAHFKLIEANAKLSIGLYISEILISNWIYKSSSLPLLDRFNKRDDSPLRLTLLPEDVNSSLDHRIHSEKQAMDGSEMCITSTKRSHGPSEKKTGSKKTNSSGSFLVGVRRCSGHTLPNSFTVLKRNDGINDK